MPQDDYRQGNKESEQEMTITRKIAVNLANHLASNQWAPEGFETPLICLDAITTTLDLSKRPAVIVVPRSTTGLWKNTPQYQLEVVLALDASSFVANAAQQTETPEGVQVMGAGVFLDSLLESLVNTIKKAHPGAILTNIGVEYSLDTLPIQFATLNLEYDEVVAYGDFCKNITY